MAFESGEQTNAQQPLLQWGCKDSNLEVTLSLEPTYHYNKNSPYLNLS